MSDRAARAIKQAAIFHFFSRTNKKTGGEFAPQTLRIPLLASLHALAFSPRPVNTLLSAKGYAAIAAHIHVRFGTDALNSFYFWGSFQRLRALLKYIADTGEENGAEDDGEHDPDFISLLLDELESFASAIGLEPVLASAFSDLRALLEPAGKRHPERWVAALRIMDEQVSTRASGHLQIIDRFESGATHVPGSSYSEVYRLAVHSGRLRASTQVGFLTLLDGHETLRVGYELLAIMERLGMVQSLPPGLPGVRKGLQRLGDLRLDELPANDLDDTFFWLESFLGMEFGGRTDVVHRAAYEAEYLAGLVLAADAVGDQLRTTLTRLLETMQELGGGPGEVVAGSIERVLDSPEADDVREEESERVRAAVATWLDLLVVRGDGIESFIPRRIFPS
ncbi:MAG TPA: hypothetical protein VHG08_25020 [Longimicrobium sp.]|nr:hypothetical protein [Longimicrobium sp.]